MSEKRKTLKVAGMGNFSLLQSHIDYLSHLGNGNKSEGVRRLIALAQEASTCVGLVQGIADYLWSNREGWKGSGKDNRLLCLADILEEFQSGDADNKLPEPE